MSAIAVPFRSLRGSKAPALIAGVLAIDAIAVGSLRAADAPSQTLAIVGVAVLLVPCALYLAAFVRPVYLLSMAVFLAMFSGNWHYMHLPSRVAPDRFLFIVGIGVFLLRDPVSGERRPLRFSLTYVLLGLAAAYTIGSAVAAHTLFGSTTLWPLVDRFGLVPFALFVVAPAVFATERDRQILLVALVAMAAYLVFVTTAQGVHLDALVYPKYILNYNIGAHQVGRARGPFGDSSTNGLALFTCAIACALAARTWRTSRWRWIVAALGFLCLFDIVFTLDRSAFIGSVAGTIVMMLAVRKLRAYLPVVLLIGAMSVGGALLVSGSLRSAVSHRITQTDSVWDRLNTDAAAERMFLARPLTGFGWGTFIPKSINYFKLSSSYPFSGIGTPDHNVFLSNLAELGIIGTGLWTFGLLFVVGGAIVRRGPPELIPWRVGLIGIAVMWLVVANFTPMLSSVPNQLLWLWAGVAWPLRYGLQRAGAGPAGATAAVAAAPAAAVSEPALHVPPRRPLDHPGRREPVAHGARRRVATRTRMTLMVLSIGALAALGFLAGQATAGGSAAAPPVRHATSTASPAYAQKLDAVMAKLNATRSSATARLRGAHDPKAQVAAAQALASAHTQAAAAVAALPAGAATTVNSALEQALKAVSSAYASLARAAAHNDGRAYRSAQTAVMRANESLGTAFAQLRRFGYQLS
jgi:O-antigen ligase